ncbi:MAG: FecR domain-containing protein [Alphaproteobacteria bacterium]|nr:FecR domain-containing protein [Alphaproteobacteria bacterium]
MAYTQLDNLSDNHTGHSADTLTLQADGAQKLDVPDSSFIRDADLSRDGMDLVLQAPDGHTVVIEDYFAQSHPPALVAPNGMMLSPELVNSFVHSGNHYADARNQATDISPVGAVQEMTGDATITRANGTTEHVGIGTPVYEGDIIETDENGAINILFVDNTTFAVSEDARLAIDEYVFDPATQTGTSDFSVLKGVFVFTSGLIGRSDPDHVEINTPSGSIGIRGTIIAGDVDTGEITVIEGAIVLHDFNGNSVTLSNQYETAKFIPSANTIEHLGTLSADNITGKFVSVSTVSGDLFTSIQDSAADTGQDNADSSATDDSSSASSTTDSGTDDSSSSTTTDEGASLSDPVTSQDIVQAGTTTLQVEPKLATAPLLQAIIQQTTTQDTTVSGTTDPIITKADTIIDPAALFHVEIQKLTFTENVNGSAVARIKGVYTDSTRFALTGVSRNFFDLVQEDANTVLVRLKSGVSMDFEKYHLLTFTATNELGTQTVSQVVNLSILNVDEPVVLTGAEPSALYSASEGNFWSHNFAIDFFDPEGKIDHYEIIPGGLNADPDVASYNFDATTGVLVVNFDSSFASDATYSVTVRAVDAGGTLLSGAASETITFYKDATNGTLSTGGATVSFTNGNDSLIGASAVNSNSNKLFMAYGDDSVVINGNNNIVNAGHGTDTITVTGTGNTLVGGGGKDIFILQGSGSSQNYYYGGEDGDTFKVLNTSALSSLSSAGVSHVIDGGSGGNGPDVLEIAVGGNLDFTIINNNYIKNIEQVNTDNGSANTITLKYSDIVSMTDSNNKLTINMDNNDTLNFDTEGKNFYAIGDGNSGYQAYSDGTVTLLVDNQHANLVVT